jgi:hypothetical protein
MSCRSAQNIATLPPAKFGESSGQGTLMKVHATHLYSTAEFHPAPVQKFRPGSGLALTNQNLPNKAGTNVIWCFMSNDQKILEFQIERVCSNLRRTVRSIDSSRRW